MSQPSPSPSTYAAVPLPRARPLLSPHLERLLTATLPWLRDAEADMGLQIGEADERDAITNCRRWLATHAGEGPVTRELQQEVEDLEQLLVDALGHHQSRRRRRLAMLEAEREAY